MRGSTTSRTFRFLFPTTAHRDHGRVGVRQIVARLRHDLRRGPAALRGIALRLCAPVPGAHGKARRGRHRRHRARRRHPPEEHHAQSALDRRHLHGVLRLPAPALRARRARPSAPTAARACARTRWTKWRRACSRSPRARAGTRCFPCGEHATSDALRDHLFELRKKGFNRLFQGGRLFEFSTPESLLDIDFTQAACSSWWTASRSRPDLHQRLVDTIEICYREAGEVIFESAVRRRRALRFNEKLPVQDLRHGVRRSRSRSCSASTRPSGACPRCQGFGNTIDFDMNRVIPDPVALARRRRGRSVDQAEVPLLAGQFQEARARQGPHERAGLRSHARRSARRSTSSSAASSITWKARSTRCTCASS